MTARSLVVPVFTCLAILFARAAEATPILLVENGKLIGAQNVQVGANLYSVELWDGTCGVLFRTCDLSVIDVGLPDFAFTTATDASAAAQALLDQVFVDSALGNFDTGTQNIRGCVIPEACTAFVPFSFLPAGPLSSDRVESASAVNFMGNLVSEPDRVDTTIVLDLDFNTAPQFGLDAFVWARFTPAGAGPFPDPVTSITEPNSFLLLGIGLAAVWGRQRQRKSASGYGSAFVGIQSR